MFELISFNGSLIAYGKYSELMSMAKIDGLINYLIVPAV